MATEEDVPPLEDMSELIKQVDALRELKEKSGSRQGSHKLQNGHGNGDDGRKKELMSKSAESKPVVQEQPAAEQQHKTNDTVSVKTDNSCVSKSKSNDKSSNTSSFGGMKKGFLFGGAPKAKPVQASKTGNTGASNHAGAPNKSGSNRTLEDIPFVRKNDGAKSQDFRFSEVQEAMEKTNTKLMENKEWVTDDLLTKLEKNEKLTKRLQDPKFIQAIGEFQKNPTAALQKYGDNEEVQEFFKDFCGLMGDHFNKLGDQQDNTKQSSSPPQPKIVPEGGADMQVRSSSNPNQPTAADEAKMQEILSDPEIRDVLIDPQIQDLFQQLRTDPGKGERILQTASGDLRIKIQKLVQAGLLQFQKT